MDAFDSSAGMPPPFGMTQLDKLAWLNMIFTQWRDLAKEESHQRILQQEAAHAAPWPIDLSASAPPLEAPAPPGGILKLPAGAGAAGGAGPIGPCPCCRNKPRVPCVDAMMQQKHGNTQERS